MERAVLEAQVKFVALILSVVECAVSEPRLCEAVKKSSAPLD